MHLKNKAYLFLKVRKLHSIHGEENCSKIQFAFENSDVCSVYSSKKGERCVILGIIL